MKIFNRRKPLEIERVFTNDISERHQRIIKRIKIAVHLHIFYKDQIDKMLFYVSNLKKNEYIVDLFVTIVDNDKSTIEKLKESAIKANIYVVPNKGYDVAPFLYVLGKINLDDYDYVIKIHTKNEQKVKVCDWHYLASNGYLWGKALLDALLVRKFLCKNLRAFNTDKNLGMIGAQSFILEERKFNEEALFGIPKEMKKIGLPIPKTIQFVAGTMFMVRAGLLKPIQKAKYTFDDFEDSKKTGEDDSLAHILERLFGAIIVSQGYSIKGFDWSLKLFIRALLFKLKLFFFKKKVTKNGRLIIKICKIPVYMKQSDDVLTIKRSKFFDELWYLGQYPEIKQSRYSPATHYLKYGWKKGYNPSDKFNTDEYLRQNQYVNECPLIHYERSRSRDS